MKNPKVVSSILTKGSWYIFCVLLHQKYFTLAHRRAAKMRDTDGRGEVVEPGTGPFRGSRLLGTPYISLWTSHGGRDGARRARIDDNISLIGGRSWRRPYNCTQRDRLLNGAAPLCTDRLETLSRPFDAPQRRPAFIASLPGFGPTGGGPAEGRAKNSVRSAQAAKNLLRRPSGAKCQCGFGACVISSLGMEGYRLPKTPKRRPTPMHYNNLTCPAAR